MSADGEAVGGAAGQGAVARFLDPQARQRLTRRSTWRALAWFLPEYAAWIVLAGLALGPFPAPVSLGFAVLAGLAISVVFTVGHDASHQALTPHRWLNRLIARLAFIPSAHAASLWDLGHNRIHHRYTNLLGADYVWEPMTPGQYRHAGRLRRGFYRLCRSGAGHLPYYLVEMWWKKNFLPIAPEARTEWRRHVFDSAFVVVAQGLVIWGVIALGARLAPDRPWQLSLTYGWLVPFLLWNWLMGLVIYMHHTHPRIGWLASPEAWNLHGAAIAGTVEARMPGVLDWIDNHIMQHNAHHALPAIPMYNLQTAQQRLRRTFPEVLSLTITPRSVLNSVRACKLYDPDARCWRDFQGRTTASVG